MRKFNVTGTCMHDRHYMVDIKYKIEKIKMMVDDGQYFTINRARQYGKTTAIRFVAERLKDEYIVINTSFEGSDDVVFSKPQNFNEYFIKKIIAILKKTPTCTVDLNPV